MVFKEALSLVHVSFRRIVCKDKFLLDLRTIRTNILQKLSKTSNSVPTHFGFTAIRVVNAHCEIIVVGRSLEGENNSIATDPKVSMTQTSTLFGGQRWRLSIAIVNKNEIISETFVFGELNEIVGGFEQSGGRSWSSRGHASSGPGKGSAGQRGKKDTKFGQLHFQKISVLLSREEIGEGYNL